MEKSDHTVITLGQNFYLLIILDLIK